MSSSSHNDGCECQDCNDARWNNTNVQLTIQAGMLAMSACEHYRKHMFKNPKRDSALPGHAWIWELWHGNEHRFFENMRMRKPVLRRLLTTLVEIGGLDSNPKRVSLEESIAIFLLILGQGCTYPVVEERQQRSSETVSNHFHVVLDAVVKLGKKIIRPLDPSFANIPDEIINNPFYYPFFEGCVGAMDGTQIEVHVPAEERTPWYNWKGTTSTNVLTICDFNMRIIFATIGMEGSMHDARVLSETVSNKRRQYPHPPPGKYYLADAAYPLTSGILTPYRRTRYHIPEFQSNRRFNSRNELFNYRHSSLRSVIERTFGVIKKRWRVINTMSNHSLDIQFKIIWACFTLHNFVRMYDADDLDLLGDIQMEEPNVDYNERSINVTGLPYITPSATQLRDMEQMRDTIRDALMDSVHRRA